MATTPGIGKVEENPGDKTKMTPTKPKISPTTWRFLSLSPKIFTPRSETKTGCKLVTTAATPAESPTDMAKKTPPR